MSKSLNLEVVDIVDSIVVMEADNGFVVELEIDTLPANIKIGQSIKCIFSLNPLTVHRESYEPKQHKNLPNGKMLSY